MPVSVDFVVFISFVIFFLACETTRRRVACTIYFLFYPFGNELIFLCRTAILIKVKESPYPLYDFNSINIILLFLIKNCIIKNPENYNVQRKELFY